MFDTRPRESSFTRRAFIFAGASVAAGAALIAESGWFGALANLGGPSLEAKPGTVTLAEFDNAGRQLGERRVPTIIKSDTEWRRQLSAQSFAVTRRGATEIAFTGPLNDCYKPGVYRCICCATAQYSSKTKYDPHEGWPSFWAPIASENFTRNMDGSLGMERIEVRCARCAGHLGHVFDDGPRPTGLRYCINSAALQFSPAPR